MTITPAERTLYQSELSTLLSQMATKKAEHDSARAALDSARATWVTKKGELEALDSKVQDRRIWIST